MSKKGDSGCQWDRGMRHAIEVYVRKDLFNVDAGWETVAMELGDESDRVVCGSCLSD